MNELEIGQLVYSKQGRDKDSVYVVVELIDQDFVKVSDGRKRPLSRPKKKNIKHLQKVNKFVSVYLAEKLERKKASDRQIKEELESMMAKVD